VNLALLLVFWFDIQTHGARQQPTVWPSLYEPNMPVNAKLAPKPAFGTSRILRSREAEQPTRTPLLSDAANSLICHRLALNCNCNLLDGLAKFDGFFSLYLKEEARLRSNLFCAPGPYPEGLVSFLGISHTTAPTNVTNWYFTWIARTNFLPLLTAGQKPVYAGDQQTLAELFRPDFDGRQVVYLPPSAQGSIPAIHQATVQLRAPEFSPNKIRFLADATAPSLVVVAQSFYPAWRAYVDRQPTALWRANYAFQALVIPAGSHQVTLAYEDRPFVCGGFISAGTLVLLAVLWWRFRAVRESRAPTAVTRAPGATRH
jgi:hypothetical protein